MSQGPSRLQQLASQRAHDHLVEGWNCAQSVLLTVQELLDLPDQGALRAATGFGGGVGNVGSLCGALAGGVMALGLLYGRKELSEFAEKERTYSLCALWHDTFVSAMGESHCRQILGVDLRDPAVRKQYWASAQNRERCATRTVGAAAGLLMALVEETGARPGAKNVAASEAGHESGGG